MHHYRQGALLLWGYWERFGHNCPLIGYATVPLCYTHSFFLFNIHNRLRFRRSRCWVSVETVVQRNCFNGQVVSVAVISVVPESASFLLLDTRPLGHKSIKRKNITWPGRAAGTYSLNERKGIKHFIIHFKLSSGLVKKDRRCRYFS